MTQQDWFQWYIANDAFWQHDGNMSRPHAETTSGLHTGTIFNSRILIENEFMLDLAVSDLLKQEDFFYIDTVAGPQTGATKLAQRIADKIGSVAHSVSPAKDIIAGKKRMVFETSDQEYVGRGKVVLLCEDVVTTGGSIRLTEQAILELGGEVVTKILVLVNRSGDFYVDDKEIISLINLPAPVWTPEECPYCKKGSLHLRPKDPKNWALLKGQGL